MGHGNRPRGAELRAHLDRLIDQLDDSCLRATLKLMVREARDAIRRQEDLIALERLDGRDTTARMDRLRELKDVQDELMAVHADRIEAPDDLAADESDLASEPAHPASTLAATAPLACAFTRLAMAAPQEQEVQVGSFSVARLWSQPGCTQPPVGHRQGRHGARAVR